MAAFAKRIGTIALHYPPHAVLALLAMIFQMLKEHPRCRSMLEHNLVGTGAYDCYAKDPAHSNALASTLWELGLLKYHFHPFVAQYATALAAAFDDDGPTRTAGTSFPFAGVRPLALFSEYNASAGGFNPPPTLPPEVHPLAKKQKKLASSRKRKRDEQAHVFIAGEREFAPSPFLKRCFLEGGVKKEEEDGKLNDALLAMWNS